MPSVRQVYQEQPDKAEHKVPLALVALKEQRDPAEELALPDSQALLGRLANQDLVV